MTYDMNKMDAIHGQLVSISADLKRLLEAQPDHIQMETKPIDVRTDTVDGKGRIFFQPTEPPVAERKAVNLWIDTGGYLNVPLRWDGRKWQMVSRS